MGLKAARIDSRWLAHAQTLAVVKQLQEVGGSKEGQMMVQMPNVQRLIGSLTMPGSGKSNTPRKERNLFE